MHEMSLCRALIASAERELSRHPDCSLTSIQVSVGALSGCEPDLLEHLFPHAAAGTCAANSRLEIQFQSASVSCTVCAQESTALPNDLCCKACGSAAVRLIAGDGVFLTGVGLRKTASYPEGVVSDV
jgi:hydrogenase nickel incorporation protein HypA/HybF